MVEQEEETPPPSINEKKDGENTYYQINEKRKGFLKPLTISSVHSDIEWYFRTIEPATDPLVLNSRDTVSRHLFGERVSNATFYMMKNPFWAFILLIGYIMGLAALIVIHISKEQRETLMNAVLAIPTIASAMIIVVPSCNLTILKLSLRSFSSLFTLTNVIISVISLYFLSPNIYVQFASLLAFPMFGSPIYMDALPLAVRNNLIKVFVSTGLMTIAFSFASLNLSMFEAFEGYEETDLYGLKISFYNRLISCYANFLVILTRFLVTQLMNRNALVVIRGNTRFKERRMDTRSKPKQENKPSRIVFRNSTNRIIKVHPLQKNQKSELRLYYPVTDPLKIDTRRTVFNLLFGKTVDRFARHFLKSNIPLVLGLFGVLTGLCSPVPSLKFLHLHYFAILILPQNIVGFGMYNYEIICTILTYFDTWFLLANTVIYHGITIYLLDGGANIMVFSFLILPTIIGIMFDAGAENFRIKQGKIMFPSALLYYLVSFGIILFNLWELEDKVFDFLGREMSLISVALTSLFNLIIYLIRFTYRAINFPGDFMMINCKIKSGKFRSFDDTREPNPTGKITPSNDQ